MTGWYRTKVSRTAAYRDLIIKEVNRFFVSPPKMNRRFTHAPVLKDDVYASLLDVDLTDSHILSMNG